MVVDVILENYTYLYKTKASITNNAYLFFNHLNVSVLCMKITQDNLFQIKNIESY